MVETVPRSFKGCLEKVFEEIEEKEGETVYQGMMDGLRAEPPKSFPYYACSLSTAWGRR